MIEKAIADEKVQAGWIRANLIFEVLAKTEEGAKKALDRLTEKLEQDPKAKVYKKEFSDSKRIENPLKT